MLPVADMLLFVDVVKLKSFSVAAKKHKITAAAVSKRISSLESRLDVKLLIRSTRKMVATDAGEILYQHCSRIYYDINEAYNAVIDIHHDPIGHLSISAPTNFSNIVLAPIVSTFVKKYPGIDCEVILDDTRVPPPLGECDLAIRAGNLSDSSFIARKLIDVEFVVCATADYYKEHAHLKRTLIPCLENYKQLSIPVSIIYPHMKRHLPKKISLFIDYLYYELSKTF